MGKLTLIALWFGLFLLFSTLVAAADIVAGTVTLKANEGFNFSSRQLSVEKNSVVTGADIVYHDYIQTRERGLRITRNTPLSALYDTKDHIYFSEVSLFKTSGQIEDCISNNYYLKVGIAPTLRRSYCVILDKKDEVAHLNKRRLVRLQVVKLTKDTITLEWKYLDSTAAPVVEEQPVPVSAPEPAPSAPAEKNVSQPASEPSTEPLLPVKKTLKKHNWKPWAIGWGILFVVILAYFLVRGFGRRK
mgnify:CR=1 FL=1